MEESQIRRIRDAARDALEAVDLQILALQRKREVLAGDLESAERGLDRARHPVARAILLGERLEDMPKHVFETPLGREDLERLASLQIYFQPNRAALYVGSHIRRDISQSLSAGSPVADFLLQERPRLERLKPGRTK